MSSGKFWLIRHYGRNCLTGSARAQIIQFVQCSLAGTWVFWPHCPQSATPSSTFSHLQRQELPLIESRMQLGLGIHALHLQFWCTFSIYPAGKHKRAGRPVRKHSSLNCVVAYACDPCTFNIEAGGSWVQSHLYSKCEAGLDYIRE